MAAANYDWRFDDSQSSWLAWSEGWRPPIRRSVCIHQINRVNSHNGSESTIKIDVALWKQCYY